MLFMYLDQVILFQLFRDSFVVLTIGLFQLTSRSVSRDPLVGRNTTFAISFVLQTNVLLPWFVVHSTEFAIESAI